MRFAKQKSVPSSPIAIIKNAGFTLVELLIVVIILAILAAILVPQFAGSTDDAKLSALDSNLSAMRSAIALYRQQHGSLPGSNTAVPATACDGTAGTGDGTLADAATGFTEQLSMYTNIAGGACSKATDAGGTKIYSYGPYFGKAELPNNPFTGVNTLLVVEGGDLNMTSAVTNGGWKYDRLTGKFIADDNTDNRDKR